MCYILVIAADIGIQWAIPDSIQILKYLNLNETLYRHTWMVAQTGTVYEKIVKDSKQGEEGWNRGKMSL